MSRTVGYTRPLREGEILDAERDALHAAGAADIFTDASADAAARDGWKNCLRAVEPGDEIVVTGANRLAATISQFTAIRAELVARGLKFRSLTEPALSTSHLVSPDAVFAALDGLRRRLMGLRTREGMEVAAAAGRRPGRPPVMTAERAAIARELRNQDRSVAHIARVLGVSRGAVHRTLNAPTDT